MKDNYNIVREPIEVPETVVKEVAVANCKNLNVRSSPNLSASITTVISEGTRLKVLKQPEPADQWIHISTEDKKPIVGYVVRKYVRVI